MGLFVRHMYSPWFLCIPSALCVVPENKNGSIYPRCWRKTLQPEKYLREGLTAFPSECLGSCCYTLAYVSRHGRFYPTCFFLSEQWYAFFIFTPPPLPLPPQNPSFTPNTPPPGLGVWVFALRDECWKIIVMVWKKGDLSILFEPIKLSGGPQFLWGGPPVSVRASKRLS